MIEKINAKIILGDRISNIRFFLLLIYERQKERRFWFMNQHRYMSTEISVTDEKHNI